ncbi:Fur family transcriptional regulator [Endothiovibrio diazotrophicus]
MNAIHPHRPAPRQGIVELLQAHDIVPTQQRVEIARWLFSEPRHLCAEQLIGLVGEAGCRVSKATVYNTLGLFVGRGLVRELIVDPERVFYDTSTHHHHHFFNVDTSELIDIPEEALAIAHLPEAPLGTETTGVQVIIRIRNSRQ